MVPVIENGCGGTEQILFVSVSFSCFSFTSYQRSRGTNKDKEPILEKGREMVRHMDKERM